LIDFTSQSRLVLSGLGKNLQKIVIIAESSWPSWLYVLDFFLESSDALVEVTILVPSFENLDLFGTSRKSKVKWRKLDLLSPISHQARNWSRPLLASSDLILYDGSLLGFSNLVKLSVSDTSIISLLPGSARLRQLKKFSTVNWKHLKHASVGGATSGSFWLGSSCPLRSSSVTPPTYCPTVLSDILEFAPKHSKHHPQPLVITPHHRHPDLCPHSSLPQTWWNHGLYSYQAFPRPSSSFVITTSPFVQSGWCQRTLSVKETARLFDVPVAIEKRLASAHTSQLPPSHALLSSVPAKVLQHSLWLTGHFCVQQQGVEDIFRPNFTIEAKSGLLVAQDKFNLGNQERSKNIDILAAKVDNAEVPVDLWNSRILHTSPSSLELNSMDSQKFVRIIDWLRTRALCRWKANILKSFKQYLKITWPNDYKLYFEGKRGKSKIWKLEKSV
jgi:hypothetical protein